jgi:hypothetical protein
MVPSRNKNAVFKLMLHSNKLGGFIDKLINMPGVEDLVENTVREPRASNALKKYTLSLATFLSPSESRGMRSLKKVNARQVREVVLN